MKKLLAIALMTLSPLTFAKDFNPDLLVGTWQCRGAFHFPESIGQESYTQIYDKDGTGESRNLIQSKDKGQKNIVTMRMKGKWRLKGDILSENTENLIEYQASDKSREKEDEDFIQKDKSFYDVKLIGLTKNRFSYMQTAQDELENRKFKFTCVRIKAIR